MNRDEAILRIRQLRDEINHHNYLYYLMAQPEIADYDFDCYYLAISLCSASQSPNL